MRAAERAIAERHPGAVRIIGNGEIAWRGTEILEIFDELSTAHLAVRGLEQVYFAEAGGRPMVEAISDLSAELPVWRREHSWKETMQIALQRSVAAINRNVKNPYSDDIWYVVDTEEDPNRA